MKVVILERNTIGLDVPVTPIDVFGDVTVYGNTKPEEAAAHIGDAEIVIANKCKLNATTMAGCENVKLICEFATGYDNIDLEYCKDKGIAVCNVAGYSTPAVVQHTFALAFYLLEHLPFYDRFVKDGTYGNLNGFSYFEKTFTELEGKTWGIVGMGNIGKGVAKVAESFGCKVICYSASGRSLEEGYHQVDFEELLAQSDFLSLHCPLTEKTKHLIDGAALKKMKKTAILINVARGPVVDNAALYEALCNDEIAAAGLDVLEGEPITPDNPLGKIKDEDKLIITPHMAWASTEARNRVVTETVENIQAFLRGEKRNRII
ncbi:MAG: D-2-hydroxyacid dehydrogenase [Lachnospiraceae bacterium]|nr:D-2-hydroxyacid dehydrogenase [Lachnospiraceae bacterium]